MAVLNFDATQVAPDQGILTVPAGWYNVFIDESDLKPTKDGLGTYLQLRFNIMDGQYKGRKLFSRLNVRNSNAQAQEIALAQLSAIGHAVGILQIQDSQMLHGISLKVKTKIRKGDDQYEDANELIAYKNINEPVDVVGAEQSIQAPPVGFGQPQAAPVAQQGFAPPQAAPQAFQPQAQQQFAPPVEQQQQQFQPPVQQQQAPAPVEQPWAQAPVQQFAQPDAANPFQQQPPVQQQQPAPQPVQQQQAPAQVQQPWDGGQVPVQQQQAQQAAPVADPALAAGVAAAQGASPPWAPQQ